jgi:hypothetical protein
MVKTLSALLVVGSLALAQSAAATDYCVNASCGGTPEPTLEDALAAAASATDADRVFLGAGTYTAPSTLGYVSVAPDSPVEIIGAGAGQTILTAPTLATGVLTLLGSAASSVHDLTVRLPYQAAANAVALETSATAKRIAVNEDPSQGQARRGVFLEAGGTLEDSTVEIGAVQYTSGVAFSTGGGALRNSTVSASTAVESDYGGVIERSRLSGRHNGLVAFGGQTTIRNSLVHISGAAGIGLQSQVLAPGNAVTLEADGLTITGPATSNSEAAFAFNNVSANANLTLRNSVIRDFGHALDAQGWYSAGATITASYSDYDGTMNTVGPIETTVAESHITNVGNGGFADLLHSDYRLAPASALIDAGDPATADGLDLDGKPLLTDGDSDGSARRDIGAFEYQPAPVTSTPAGTGSSGDLTPPLLPPGTAADTNAPSVSSFASSRTRFAVGRARTAISAVARGTQLRYTLSEPAKVTIAIKRLGARRAAGKLVRSGKAGRNTIKFSGRIGTRALKRGRYRATITAVDGAGNRSAPRRLVFRIVRR